MCLHPMCTAGALAILLCITSPLIAQQAAESTVQKAWPELSTGPLRSSRLTSLPAGVLVRSGQLRITQQEVDSELRKAPQELQQQLRASLFFMVENQFADRVMRWEAANWAQRQKKSLTGEAAVRAFANDLVKSVSVSEADLREFYENNREMMGGASFEQVKANLRDMVLQQKRQEVIQRHLNTISDRYEVEVDRAWVQRQYTASLNNPVDKARRSGRPSLVNFGSDGCRPCDMMTPIRNAIQTEYAGKLNVLFVHVRKERVLAARYGIESIPVQILFDAKGREVFRHVGFWPKEQIVAKLAAMGVK